MAKNHLCATNLPEWVVNQRLKNALRHHVGTGRPWSVSALAAEIGVQDREIRAYRDNGGCLPSLLKFIRISVALGPEAGAHFLNEVLSVAGFEGIRHVAAQDDNPFTAQMALAEALVKIAGWLSDGKFDHAERREAVPVMLATIAQLSTFVAGLQAGQED